jgi:hypothetical protein
MGRQIQIAATPVDEERFLAFLREGTDIAILECFSVSREELWVESFSASLQDHRSYCIWNKAFAWEPEYNQVRNARPSSRNGLWYVSNKEVAPVIDFHRSDVPARKYGRIYWVKDFAAPDGLSYDVAGLGVWYDGIAKWIRKHGKRKQGDRLSPYFLPDAWRIVSETQ